MRVAVVGAGPAGLATTIALRAAGISAHCYERAAGLDREGTGLTLWPNGISALDSVGAGGVVRSCGLPATGMAIWDAAGKVLHHVSADAMESAGGNGVAVHRAELVAGLYGLLEPDAVTFGARCVGADPAGRIRFADGTVVDADLVVGADGVGSVVRATSGLGTSVRPAGFTVRRAVIPFSLPAGPGLLTMGGPAAFGTWRLTGERVYWFASAPDGGLDRFADWHDPIPALIAATPEERIVVTDVRAVRRLPTWHRGRVVLVGDAAHPALPNLGQGTSQAFEDAMVLAECVATARPDAPGRYERRRMRRADSATSQAAAMARVGAWRGPVACRLRDRMIALAPVALQLARLRGMFALPPR